MLLMVGGYLIAFLRIFLEAAWPKSIPQISDSLMRYKSTSESSSPRCSLSDSSQFGNPLSTSPFHWNISDSSPTSPTCSSYHIHTHTKIFKYLTTLRSILFYFSFFVNFNLLVMFGQLYMHSILMYIIKFLQV